MRTIEIKSLSLRNFKGIPKWDIKSFEKETFIYGANGTGKTSLFDAFTWLLFGKNSHGETNFGIKPLDENNNTIPKLTHEVVALISVDGEQIKLKRTFKEKWVKKKGALEAEFVGNENLFEWNDVPVILRDYTAKINDLVDESVFKLITSPTAFNALKWQDQRQVLIDIAGDISDEEIINGDPEFKALFGKLENKSITDYEKQIKSSIRKSKEEINAIPTRIDEVDQNKPEALDFTALETELAGKKKQLSKIEEQISDKLAAQQEVLNRRSKLQKEIHALESEIEDEKHKLKLQAKSEYQKQNSQSNEISSQIESKSNDLNKAKKTLKNISDEIKAAKEEIAELQNTNDEIRKDWKKRNAEEFQMDESACKCPTCKREFEAEDIEAKKKELFENFQMEKRKRLNQLTEKGQKNAATIKELEAEITTLEERKTKGEGIEADIIADLEELSCALDTAEDNSTNIKTEKEIADNLIKDSQVIPGKIKELNKLDKELTSEKGVDTSELTTQKDGIEKEIESIKKQLSVKDQIEAADKRIELLSKEESQLAQQIADYEKDQFTIERFTKARMDALESKINDRFELVNFKLFESQVNGAEVPTCKALVNGVPFSDLNTAMKINSGLDIINTLTQHYQVNAPVWIDNRESVTDLIDSPAQIINLVVDPTKPKLEVKSNVEQLETV